MIVNPHNSNVVVANSAGPTGEPSLNLDDVADQLLAANDTWLNRWRQQMSDDDRTKLTTNCARRRADD